ncbi:MAG: hypothetical protein WCK42_01140 [Myxococcaceae bacterium]
MIKLTKNISVLCVLLFSVSCRTNYLWSLQQALGVGNLTSLKRTARQERWDLTDDPKWDRMLILKDLSKLGFVNTVKPTRKEYQTAVLLGSTGPSMENRINYLIETWQAGVRFKRIVFLTGDRILSAIDQESFLGLAKNETELFKKLWQQAKLPEELGKLPEVWIDAPQIAGKRPTTVSTIVEWRQKEDLIGEDILAFSHQPFVGYQECTLVNYLPKSAQVEAVGPAARPGTLISVYVDALVNCQEFCAN